MVSLKMLISAVAFLATAAFALPASAKLTSRQLGHYKIAKRQNEMAKSMGLTDVDILQFALTLERLEAKFYGQALGTSADAGTPVRAGAPVEAKRLAVRVEGQTAGAQMDEATRKTLETIRNSEEAHVIALTSAIAQAGAKPVETCKYNFNTSNAKAIVETAAVLENAGVSAYLGAAGAITDKKVLTVAASIVTVEARHQTSVRSLLQQDLVPEPFDTPLSPRAAFSLAKPFIASCPEGSNLPIEAFPTLSMMPGQEATAMSVGSVIELAAEGGGASAENCAFTTSTDKATGGALFVPFTEATGCQVPDGVADISYAFLTSSQPADGAITDDIVVAGPMVLTFPKREHGSRKVAQA